jgi:hypothetical protein
VTALQVSTTFGDGVILEIKLALRKPMKTLQTAVGSKPCFTLVKTCGHGASRIHNGPFNTLVKLLKSNTIPQLQALGNGDWLCQNHLRKTVLNVQALTGRMSSVVNLLLDSDEDDSDEDDSDQENAAVVDLTSSPSSSSQHTSLYKRKISELQTLQENLDQNNREQRIEYRALLNKGIRTEGATVKMPEATPSQKRAVLEDAQVISASESGPAMYMCQRQQLAFSFETQQKCVDHGCKGTGAYLLRNEVQLGHVHAQSNQTDVGQWGVDGCHWMYCVCKKCHKYCDKEVKRIPIDELA